MNNGYWVFSACLAGWEEPHHHGNSAEYDTDDEIKRCDNEILTLRMWFPGIGISILFKLSNQLEGIRSSGFTSRAACHLWCGLVAWQACGLWDHAKHARLIVGLAGCFSVVTQVVWVMTSGWWWVMLNDVCFHIPLLEMAIPFQVIWGHGLWSMPHDFLLLFMVGDVHVC